MNFLAPAAAWALVLALPIVALYLRQEQARRLSLSTWVLWRDPAPRLRESKGWRRLRHPLSLLLQLVFVLLLVLALMRPRLGSAAGPLVMVLDRSASMGATDAEGTRLEQAAGALARLAREGAGPFILIATGFPPQVLAASTSQPHEIHRLLKSISPALEQIPPGPALELARSLAKARGGQVVFATDGVWCESTQPDEAQGVATFLVGSSAPANAGLVALAASRSLTQPSEVTVLVGHGMSFVLPRPSKLLISANGRLVEARELAAGGLPPLFWQRVMKMPEAATIEARLEAPDILAADNFARLEVPPAQPLRVILVSPPHRALEKVLEAMPNVEGGRVWPAQNLAYGDPGAIYVFVGVAPPSDFQAAGILLIQPEGRGFFGERESGPEPSLPSLADSSSPVLRHLRWERWDSLEACRYSPAPNARLDLRSGENPLIFSDWSGVPKWTVLAFDPTVPSLVHSPAFPVLMANILEGLAGASLAPQVAPGLSPALTALNRQADVQNLSPAPSSPPLSWPLHQFLLLLGAAWLLLESWTYHRRITV